KSRFPGASPVIAVTWWRPPMFSIATISNRARARRISRSAVSGSNSFRFSMPSAPVDLLSTIGICVAAAALLALVGWRLRQPLILAYLITGVIIGPVGLNWVSNPASIATGAEI